MTETLAPERRPSMQRSQAGSRGWRWRVLAGRVTFLVVLFGLWEVASRREWIDPFFISQPSGFFGRIGSWVSDGSVFKHLSATLYEAAVGFVLAALIGIISGLVLARSPYLGEVTRPIVDVFNSVPRIALAPLFVLWFGLGQQAKIVLVVSVVTFPFLINAYTGVTSVDTDQLRMARSLGATRGEMLRKIVIPSITPWLFAATRLGVAFALAAAVIGEIVSASEGLGFLIAFSAGVLDTEGQFAALIVLAVVAWVINTSIARLEQWLLRWKTNEQVSGA